MRSNLAPQAAAYTIANGIQALTSAARHSMTKAGARFGNGTTTRQVATASACLLALYRRVTNAERRALGVAYMPAAAAVVVRNRQPAGRN